MSYMCNCPETVCIGVVQLLVYRGGASFDVELNRGDWGKGIGEQKKVNGSRRSLEG